VSVALFQVCTMVEVALQVLEHYYWRASETLSGAYKFKPVRYIYIYSDYHMSQSVIYVVRYFMSRRLYFHEP